jgi:hypothetical protein
LEYTAVKGRQDGWNIGIFDADGNAALYECGNYDYVKYDANNPDDAPEGYIIRATFGLSGTQNNRIGLERYKRACLLTEGRINEQPLNAKFIFQTLARDLANIYDDPYPLPYNGRQNGRPDGFIYTRNLTINRDVTRSVMVLRGVTEDEDPRLGTTFSMIGPPVIAIVFPMWVYAMDIPEILNAGEQTPMYTLMVTHRSNLYPIDKDPYYLNSHYLYDNDGYGILPTIISIENEVFRMTENYVEQWNDNMPTPADMKEAQGIISDYVFTNYQEMSFQNPNIGQITASNKKKSASLSGYPNPFNAQATIQLNGFSQGDPISVEIYDLLGRQVRKFTHVNNGESGFLMWDGTDENGSTVSTGVYLVRAYDSVNSESTKLVLMK